MTVERVLSRPECGALVLLFAIVLDSISSGCVPLCLLRKLGALNFRAHEWLRPSSKQALAAGRIKVELWSWLLGVSRWLLLTVWQLHAGRRRRAIALRRLQFLPAQVRSFLDLGWKRGCLSPLPVVDFLRLQVSESVRPPCANSVVYIVGGKRKEPYVGYSSHSRASKTLRLGAPVPRVNEHFQERVLPATSVKSHGLKLESPCDLGALVVFAGTDLRARAFEKVLIANLQRALNSVWHGPTMGKAARNNGMSSGTAARRRPPKHVRMAIEASFGTRGPQPEELSRLVDVDVLRRTGHLHQQAREILCVG